MKTIKPSDNEHQWPRQEVTSVKTRKRDLVIRIADWSKDRSEPAFDVEIYIGGVYDFFESKSLTKFEYGSMKKCKSEAVAFAKSQIEALL